MSKYGLGRGLSSLFATFEKQEEKKPVENKKDDAVKKEIKTENVKKEDASSIDVLKKAQSLINKTNEPLKDINETVERDSYLQEKEVLHMKLNRIEQELASRQQSKQDTGVLEIELNKIDVNVNQPRKTFDKEGLQELADSIKQHGVIQPIIVVQKGDRYFIVAGERRYRASKIAGLKKIPAIIKNYSTKDIKEIALIENLQREDLNPVETAFALKQLIEEYQFTQDELAEKIGKTRTVVTNFLRILKLEPEVLTMVEKGKLSFAHAKALVSITNREEQIKLAKKASDDKISSRELETIVQGILNPEKVSKNKQVIGLELKNLVKDMQQIFGTKVNVIGSDKRGRIYIDYFNQDDLDRIYALMNKLR